MSDNSVCVPLWIPPTLFQSQKKSHNINHCRPCLSDPAAPNQILESTMKAQKMSHTHLLAGIFLQVKASWSKRTLGWKINSATSKRLLAITLSTLWSLTNRTGKTTVQSMISGMKKSLGVGVKEGTVNEHHQTFSHRPPMYHPPNPPLLRRRQVPSLLMFQQPASCSHHH